MRKLKFPEKLTLELAEDIGIMVGDGHIGSFHKGGANNTIEVAGNMVTDKLYHSNHISGLKQRLFGLPCYFSLRPEIHTCKLRIYSKGIVEFYSRIILLPTGKKKEIHVPKIIMESNNEIKKAFLRGLGDTDFTFSFKKRHKSFLYYPSIKLGTESKNLIMDCKSILEDVGFKPVTACDMVVIHTKTKKPFTTHQLFLYGKENYEKWVREIGFSNPKNWLKYRLWKENGFCPPNAEIEKMMSEPGGI